MMTSIESVTVTSDGQTRPWFTPHLASISDDFRKLLEDRGIPSEQVISHIENVRDKAWTIHAYPCLGDFLFTRLLAPQTNAFSQVKNSLLQNPDAKLLDLGCGLGQELRNLQSVGVNGGQLVGLDYDPEMIEYGFELFNDKQTSQLQFFKGDMLDLSSMALDLHHKFNFVMANCSIHLFNWDEQLVACRTTLTLLKREPGSLVFGIQMGRSEAKILFNGRTYVHDEESFKKLWLKSAHDIGCEVEVSVDSRQPILTSLASMDPELCFWSFCVRVLGMNTAG